MENSNTKTEIDFRFTRLDKMQAITLEREILGAIREDHVENNYYVVRVPLTNNTFNDINDYYVRQRIEIEACDVFISVCSDSGTNTFEIPTIVNRMLKYIDCKLTFSFTVV